MPAEVDMLLEAIDRLLSREEDLPAKIISAAKLIEDLNGNHEYWTPEWSTTAEKAKMKDDAETHREAAETLRVRSMVCSHIFKA